MSEPYKGKPPVPSAAVYDGWYVIPLPADGFWHIDVSDSRFPGLATLYTFNARGQIAGISGGSFEAMMSIVKHAEWQLKCDLGHLRISPSKAKELLRKANERPIRKRRTRK